MNPKTSRVKSEAWLPYLVYSALAVSILGPLLLPGYVLTLDMPFGPNPNFPAIFFGLSESPSAMTPLLGVLRIAEIAMPAWLVQKLLLLLIFFLAGLGAHRLLASKGTGAYFAGILYMINPFTYVRFLAGQLGVLVAYALTPFAVNAFIRLLKDGGRRNVIKVVLLSTLVGMAQVQGYFLLFLAFFIILLGHVISERKQPAKIKEASKSVGIAAVLFCLLNAYWLIPVFSGAASLLGQLGQGDLVSFAPRATSRIMFDVASMYGFWREGYVYVQNLLPFWWLLFLFMLFLAAYGFICSLEDRGRRWIVTSFVAMAVLSFLMAVGAASDLTKPFFQWLWEHIPLIRGFRDSQKFVALLCLSYAYLGGLGVAEFGQKIRTESKRSYRLALIILVALALLTPLGYSFTMFGFHGQLKVTEYPKEWYEVNKYLNDDKDEFSVLVLPWHQYMDFGWLPNMDKRLANPARGLFDKPVIQGDNIEMPGVYSQSTNPVSKYVEFVLGKKNVNNLGELLAPLNVKYVILVHEADYESYTFLYEQTDLRVQIEKLGITVFKNEYPRAQVYAVDNVVHIGSLDEFIELSKSQDVMAHLYILGNGTDEYSGAGMEEPDYTVRNPVKYEIKAASNRYVILAMPQNVNTNHWEYDGKESLKNLGVMPAFESSPQGGEAVYTRFYHIYLPSYIVSVAALMLAFLAWYTFARNHRAASPGTLNRLVLTIYRNIRWCKKCKAVRKNRESTRKS